MSVSCFINSVNWLGIALEVAENSFEKVCELYGIPIYKSSIQTPSFFEIQKPFEVDDMIFQILFVPGHSPGHVAFYNKENNFVINGDCLFENSIGRTDLPGGNHAQLISSIKDKLLKLPDDTLVYTGHGNNTTIGAEKRGNPFLQ